MYDIDAVIITPILQPEDNEKKSYRIYLKSKLPTPKP